MRVHPGRWHLWWDRIDGRDLVVLECRGHMGRLDRGGGGTNGGAGKLLHELGRGPLPAELSRGSPRQKFRPTSRPLRADAGAAPAPADHKQTHEPCRGFTTCGAAPIVRRRLRDLIDACDPHCIEHELDVRGVRLARMVSEMDRLLTAGRELELAESPRSRSRTRSAARQSSGMLPRSLSRIGLLVADADAADRRAWNLHAYDVGSPLRFAICERARVKILRATLDEAQGPGRLR